MNVLYDLDSLFKLTPDYIQKACKVSSSAFQNNPDTMFIYPDENERKEKLKYAFEVMYRYGIRNGEVYATSSNLEGIAIWLPFSKIHQSTWNMILRYGGFRNMRKSGLKAGKRAIPLYKYIESAHERLVPFDHWYLQSIAVKPEEQRKGYGGLLLSAMIKKVDSEGLPSYVESHKKENVLFYQKYGFEIIEYTIIPKTDVPFWCMLRKPMRV